MAFMMMFVRMFYFFHNFAILLVLYNPEHSVPFSISVAKLRKGFCNLVAKVQIALLMFNGLSEDALLQFEELVALGLDYIAFSEHGEGVRWAKKLLRNTQKQIDQIQSNLQ